MIPNNPPIHVSPDFEQLYSDASRQATECAMNLVYTADLMVGRIAHLVQPFGLTPSSGLVLSIVGDSPAPLSPHEIASRLIVSRATLTGVLDSLEHRGYVQRRGHPADRRMLLVDITEKGREVAKAFRPVVHRRQREWFQVLSEAEQNALLGFLVQIQNSIADSEV